MRSRQAQLTEAMNQGILIRLSRRFEDTKIRGYVEGIGPQFVMVSLVSDRLWFDGFECFRTTDIVHMEPDPYSAFAEAALRKRKQKRPRIPRIDLANTESLLLSAAQSFPLVTIHREEIDPEVCWIGRVLSVTRGRVSLLEINPDATWDNEPNEYALKGITCVGFAADYEDALHAVGGDPPVR